MRAPDLDIRCPLSWDALEGDGDVRYCASCNRNVRDVSALSRGAARRFLDEHPDACVRFDVDDRGRLITKTVHLVVLGLAANLAACAPSRTSCPVRPPDEPLASDTEGEEKPKSELAAEIEDAGLEPRPAFGPSRRSKKLPFHLRGPHRGGGGGHMGR